MDEGLRSYLVAQGVLDDDGYSRRVSYGRCSRCHGAILKGLDAKPCGLPRRVSPTPLDAVGEAQALLLGATTYDLHRSRYHGYLIMERRDRWAMSRRSEVVVADHRCEVIWTAGRSCLTWDHLQQQHIAPAGDDPTF